MVFIISMIMGFGWGCGIQPPLDIHIPTQEEIAKEWEREHEKSKHEPIT